MIAFYYMEQWNCNINTNNQISWTYYSGIPLHAWGPDCFAKVVSGYETFVKVDKGIKELESLDTLRIVVRVSEVGIVNR